jgi:xanthine dehydrogenase accessory factor
MEKAILAKLREAREARVPAALVSDLGDGTQRLILRKDAPVDELAEALEKGFRFDESRVVGSQGREFFINIYNPPLKLVLIGAVHIAQTLIPMARLLGYRVIVIDPRGAFASSERFPDVELAAEWPDEVLPKVGLDSRTAIVLLTHDPKIDDPALELALASESFYIGALGSKRTHAQRLERFRAKGFGEPELTRIHAPIGLDIGARGAPEIAAAIAAEITKVLRRGADTP